MKSKYAAAVGKGWSASSHPATRRAWGWSLILLSVCALASIASAGLGEMRIHPLDVLRSVAGSGQEQHEMVVMQLRLPRIVLALLIGASLAAAGAILQGIVRNPMASPDVVGITGGASVAAVAFLTYAAGAVTIQLLPVTAMAGAAVVALSLYALAWKKGVTPLRLVLVGVGVAALMSALTTMMIIFSPRNDAGQAYLWMTGSVYAASWQKVALLLPWTIALLPAALLLTRHVNVQQLGDEVAIGAGSAVQRTRFMLLLISVGLAGSAVAVGGGIGFVGLIAPHMARKLIGPGFGRLLPVSALIGANLVVLADLIGRTCFLPLDVPVGIFTAAVGAPFFIYLLYAARNN